MVIFACFCAFLFNPKCFEGFFERRNVKKRQGGTLPFKWGRDVYGQCKTKTIDCRSRVNTDCRPKVRCRPREKVEKYDCKSLKLQCNDPSHAVMFCPFLTTEIQYEETRATLHLWRSYKSCTTRLRESF